MGDGVGVDNVDLPPPGTNARKLPTNLVADSIEVPRRQIEYLGGFAPRDEVLVFSTQDGGGETVAQLVDLGVVVVPPRRARASPLRFNQTRVEPLWRDAKLLKP